jgi:p-aminobenzoyl-glutamate transporter AbgT
MDRQVTSHLTKGLVIGIVLILLNLLGSIPALANTTWYRYIPSFLFFLTAMLNVIHYAMQTGNTTKFGDNFAFGFKTVAIVALIMVLYTFVSLKFIHPELREQAYSDALVQLKQQGNTQAQEAEEQARTYATKMFIPFTVAQALFATVLIGTVSSLAGAIIAKKVPN